jgi:hypothetical protein
MCIPTQVIAVTVKLDLGNTDFKGTKKLTWLAEALQEKSVPIVAVTFAHMVTKAHVTKVGL